MHYIISIIILIFIFSKVNQLLNKRNYRPPIMPEKDGRKQQIENEKALKQIEKERQQIEKNRQKIEQAQADIIFYENQLNQLTEMLYTADKTLEDMENQIKIDYLMRSYDRAAKREKQKTQIIRQIMILESKVHATENRLAKAYYITQAV